MPTPSYISRQTFVCTHCGRKQEVELHDGQHVRPGDIIRPSTSSGDFGRCVFCKRVGLRCLTAKPKKKEGPVGWRRN